MWLLAVLLFQSQRTLDPGTRVAGSVAATSAPAPGGARLPGGGRLTATLGLEAEAYGQLGPDAPQYEGHPIVFYGIRCRIGLVLGIDATSAFDNLIYLFGPAGELTRNDDANGTNA